MYFPISISNGLQRTEPSDLDFTKTYLQAENSILQCIACPNVTWRCQILLQNQSKANYLAGKYRSVDNSHIYFPP